MIPHEQLAEEIKLRQCVSRAINVVQQKLIKESVDFLNQEMKFREVVQDLIFEAATEDPAKDPHPATGINVLEDLLKKIIPIIEDDFKVLTSNRDQRNSFRAHVLRAVQNTLAPLAANEEAEELNEGVRDTIIKTLAGLVLATTLGAGAAQASPSGPQGPSSGPMPSVEELLPGVEDMMEKLTDEELLNAYVKTSAAKDASEQQSALGDLAEKIPLKRLSVKGKGAGVIYKGKLPKSALDEDVDINIEDKDEEDKFIDIDGDKSAKEEEVDPKEEFGISGEDETGRNAAYNTFKKVENQIADAYGLLGNTEDQSIFYDYLLTNLKLYFDKFEDELSPSLEEPTTAAYEKEKDKLDDEPSDEEFSL